MSLYETVMGTIRKNRESLQGEDPNCIVFPYERFRGCFPGQEKGKYYGITGNQKSAKSKWTDYTFLYEPFFDMIENNGPEIHCMYFTLEMSPVQDIRRIYEVFSQTGQECGKRSEIPG